MRKVTLLALALGMSLTTQAQQLSNANFDGAWEDCKPYTGKDQKTDVRGVQPTGWKISNVYGLSGMGLGGTIVGDTIVNESTIGKAVKLTNTPNPIVATQIVPAYLTLGTTWNTSVMGSQNDGGTFGGIQFTNKPDAVEFYYQRTDTTGIPASVIAYLWKGEWQQADVPVNIAAFGAPTTEQMINRDRNILAMATDKGGAVTKNDSALLIASVCDSIVDTTQVWTKKVVDINYHDTEAQPENLNLIFAAGDYFNAARIMPGAQLCVDSVKLVYYHALDSIVCNGNAYAVTTDTTMLMLPKEVYNADSIRFVKKGVGATVLSTYNDTTGVLTVEVRGNDFATNADSKTVYQVKFAAKREEAEVGQLFNANFNSIWEDCIPYIGQNDTAKVQSVQPEGWVISNVNGYQGLGATIVGQSVNGMEGTGLAVELTNTPNPFMASQIVPGYMGLGTAWNTSKGAFSITNKDGGNFGGIKFTNKPDAVEFYYKKSSETPNNIKSSVIAYLWKGEWQQKDVPVTIALFDEPKKETMVNRDRNILGIATAEGGEVTKSEDALLIASVIDSITTDTATWTKKVVELAYNDAEAQPEMLNIIFSANDYFDANTVIKGNSLTVDNVKLIYYHALDSVIYNNKTFGVENDTAIVDLSTEQYDANQPITFVKKGAGATIHTAYDEKNAVLTVEVRANNYMANPNNKTVYLLQFAAPQTGIETITGEAKKVDVYSVDGKLLRHQVEAADALKGLNAGIYVVNGKKMVK